MLVFRQNFSVSWLKKVLIFIEKVLSFLGMIMIAFTSKNFRLKLNSNTCKSSFVFWIHCHFSALPNHSCSTDKEDYEGDGIAVQSSNVHFLSKPLQEVEFVPPLSDKLFKHAPKSGSYKQGDSTFYSLIENYAKSGDFESLEVVFNRMKREKRAFLENNFIVVFRAYGKAHLPEKAVILFDRMTDEFQCKRTVKSFNSVLNVIVQEGLYSQALEFLSYVVNCKNIKPNVLTFNLVIRAMCKLRLIDRAVETFREMPTLKCEADVFTYCTLMDGLCKEDRVDEAVALLDEMQIEGCFPNHATFNVLINGLCKKGDLARAAKIVDNMFLKGCVPNEITYNTLLHGLCLQGKLDKAMKLLDRMVSDKVVPNDITYGTIINGLVRKGRAVDGMLVMMAVEERGHQGNNHIYSSLISGLFKEGRFEEALKLWKTIMENGRKPNTVLYSALVDGLCRKRLPFEAKEVLSEMVNTGCKPNTYTYCSIIKGFFNTGNSDMAILVWKEMAEKGLMQNQYSYSILIHGLCDEGNLKEAMMVWRQMLGKGLAPDVVAYSSMIHGLCKAGSLEQGLLLFNEMLCKDPDSQPDVITYNILFSALCKHDKISHAINLLNNMLDRGCDPDIVTCKIFLMTFKNNVNPLQDGKEFLEELFLRLHKRQHVNGASNIIEAMLQKCLYPKISTWEKIIRELCRHRKVQLAINKCWSSLFV